MYSGIKIHKYPNLIGIIIRDSRLAIFLALLLQPQQENQHCKELMLNKKKHVGCHYMEIAYPYARVSCT